MLRIRLSRTGKKRQPSYRVVVADADAKRDGRVVERIGYYNPLVNPAEYKIEESRALYWLSVGAQPSNPVRDLLKKQGTFGRLKRLHAGETLEALVAEYEGKPAEAVPVEAAPVAEAAAEEQTGLLGQIVEAVTDRVEDAVETVTEAVSAAVATVTGRDEEE
jgi:small subunit ribosomal protein S16